MGDGCRFQPLIFQGVPILSPPLLIASSTKSMNWVVVSNHGKIPKVKIPSLGNEKTYPTFGKAKNSSSKRYLYLKGDICQFPLEYIGEFLMKSQNQGDVVFRASNKPLAVRVISSLWNIMSFLSFNQPHLPNPKKLQWEQVLCKDKKVGISWLWVKHRKHWELYDGIHVVKTSTNSWRLSVLKPQKKGAISVRCLFFTRQKLYQPKPFCHDYRDD